MLSPRNWPIAFFNASTLDVIGHHFVLNGAPPELGLLGVNALTEMVCDWSVAILEDAINDRTRSHRVRKYALASLVALLVQAIEHGYCGATKEDCCRLLGEAQAKLEASQHDRRPCQIRAVEELSNHLSQVVADGLFEPLPDF